MKYTILESGIKGVSGFAKEDEFKIECPECGHLNYEKEITGSEQTKDREVKLICPCGCIYKVEK